MAHFHDKDTHHDACCKTTSFVCSQTLDELDFQKGIWGAAMDGDVVRVKTLLSSGISPNATDSAGYKPLHYAARNGHYLVCKTVLQHGADVNATTRSIGATPLHRASTQGHTEVVELLLKHGADPNLRDADGKTPLHRVITNIAVNKLDVCTLLISVTNLIIKDNSGRTVEECLQTEKLKNQKEEIAAKLKCKQMLNDIGKREVFLKKLSALEKLIEQKKTQQD